MTRTESTRRSTPPSIATRHRSSTSWTVVLACAGLMLLGAQAATSQLLSGKVTGGGQVTPDPVDPTACNDGSSEEIPPPPPPLPSERPIRGGFGGPITEINAMSGQKANFGFNAKGEVGGLASGHLNYLNHATGVHLSCTVTTLVTLTATTAVFSGTCSPKSGFPVFTACVEDNGEPGRNDVFIINYGPVEGGTLRGGNIQIHQ